MRTPRKLADRDRERAVTLICKSIVNVDIDIIKKMLCLAVGHPPIIRVDGHGLSGLYLCARCGVEVSDEVAQLAHVSYGDHLWASEKLTPTDFLLSGLPVAEKVPV